MYKSALSQTMTRPVPVRVREEQGRDPLSQEARYLLQGQHGPRADWTLYSHLIPEEEMVPKKINLRKRIAK